jgi:hypothetical protein
MLNPRAIEHVNIPDPAVAKSEIEMTREIRMTSSLKAHVRDVQHQDLTSATTAASGPGVFAPLACEPPSILPNQSSDAAARAVVLARCRCCRGGGGVQLHT